MNVDVVELICGDGSDVDAIRRLAGRSIRTGDGVYTEGGRLFVVLANMNPGGWDAFKARVTPKIEPLGGSLEPRPHGTDETADSLYRRAQSMILPVEPRN